MPLIPVRENGLWGYITETGDMAIEPKFHRAGVFGNGRAAVAMEDKLGFIDESGSVVIGCQYQTGFGGWTSTPFQDGLQAVCREETWGFIGVDGKEVIPLTFHRVYRLTDGMISVEVAGDSGKKWGVIDTSGKTVIPFDLR